MNTSTRLSKQLARTCLPAPLLQLARGEVTFASQTLPKMTKLHHPERVQENTLYPWCDITIPELPYCDFIWDNLAGHSHLPGLVCGLTNRTLLHGEVKEEALRVSSALRGLGLKKGDVLGILLLNCIEYPLIILGALHSGLTVTTMNPAYTAPELSRQLVASQAIALISHYGLQDKVGEAMRTYPNIKTTIFLEGKSAGDSSLGWDDFLNTSSDPHPQQVAVDLKKDVAFLPFSSGTTGMPKGVMLTQSNLVASNATLLANDPGYMIRASGNQQDTTIGVLPMFHIVGLNVTSSSCLHMGAKHVVLPSFIPNLYADLMERHRPDFLHAVPPLASFLANSPLVTRDHLSSLRQINVGAAPSGAELIKQFYKKAPGYVQYKEAWGTTEVSGAVSGICRAFGGIKMGSCNQILPNLRLQIRDISSDLPLGPGDRGEIVVQGPHCMLGYSNNEKANKETFDGSGWMRTGDIGYYDDDGFLYIVDRMKELIKVKGLQVAPAELEDVLRGLPGVLDVGVIGVEDERSGQVPRAFIVREEGVLTEAEVASYMEEQVAPHKQLAGGVEWVASIPKSAAGKILRKELVAMYQQNNQSSGD